jgi:hypothetical protein
MPVQYEEKFKETLEAMSVDELLHIKQDLFYANVTAWLLLAFGVLWFALWHVIASGTFFKELAIIVTWVFVWAGIEKWFFQMPSLRNRKYNLLHILSAKIKVKE